MKYCSTRNSKIDILSAEAIKNGLSSDGGLYVPKSFPAVSTEEMKNMLDMSYVDRAKNILSKYLTDFSDEELGSCVSNAYEAEKFGGENPVPTVKIGDDFYICELWHGPTCAFKDMALQILPHLLKVSIEKTGEKRTVVILVATSGDTGKAALEGFKNVDGTKIIVFYPDGGVSDIQRLQMVTQEGNNVSVAAIDGNFDNAQSGVKDIFGDKDFANELAQKGYVFSSANSINWGRLVPQIVYYFSSYLDMVAAGDVELGEKINFTVPTGNFGNILAAYYAKQMGLPVAKLICASNKNNILTDFIESGVYDRNREFYLTESPSMDILISSNLERLLYELLGKDDSAVSKLMTSLKEFGKYEISADVHNKLRENFYGGSIDDTKTKEIIKKYFDKYGYTMDTHTAVAVGVYEEYALKSGDKTKTVIMSTASPFKFGTSVLEALGDKTDITDCSLLDMLEAKTGMDMPSSLKKLATAEVRFSDVYDKNKMREVVTSFLK